MEFPEKIERYDVHHPSIPQKKHKPEDVITVIAHSLCYCTIEPCTSSQQKDGQAGMKQGHKGHEGFAIDCFRRIGQFELPTRDLVLVLMRRTIPFELK